HVDSTNLLVLRQLNPAAIVETPANFDEAALEIEIAPQKPCQLAEPEAGSQRAEQHRVVAREVPLRHMQDVGILLDAERIDERARIPGIPEEAPDLAAGFVAIAPSSINWLNVCRTGAMPF